MRNCYVSPDVLSTNKVEDVTTTKVPESTTKYNSVSALPLRLYNMQIIYNNHPAKPTAVKLSDLQDKEKQKEIEITGEEERNKNSDDEEEEEEKEDEKEEENEERKKEENQEVKEVEKETKDEEIRENNDNYVSVDVDLSTSSIDTNTRQLPLTETCPAWPITISVGDKPGCSGWQLVSERDSALTFDEQLAIAHAESVWKYWEYWNRVRLSMAHMLSSCPETDDTDSDSSNEEYRPINREDSFIDNAPPGLPKGKGISHKSKAGSSKVTAN